MTCKQCGRSMEKEKCDQICKWDYGATFDDGLECKYSFECHRVHIQELFYDCGIRVNVGGRLIKGRFVSFCSPDKSITVKFEKKPWIDDLPKDFHNVTYVSNRLTADDYCYSMPASTLQLSVIQERDYVKSPLVIKLTS
jgi:hypothetical protein